MKKLLTLIIIIISISANAQYKKAEKGKTNYKSGFVYYNRQGHKCTLINFDPSRTGYPWKVKAEFLGVTVTTYTEDCWIDLDTDKAFYNARTHQIVYYDEVDIIKKQKP